MTTSLLRKEHAVQMAIDRLQALHINFLAIDFDQTLIDVHTGGRWTGTLPELLEHVRPEFAQLVVAATQRDICVAIVTYSTQKDLVLGVLEHVLGGDEDLARRIPIRTGRRPSLYYKGHGSTEGKQAHMASAAEELENRGYRITKATTLLIDDDARNVHVALHDGTRAVWFNPLKPHRMLQDVAKLV